MQRVSASILAAVAGALGISEAADWSDLMPPGEEAPLPWFGHPGTAFELELPEQSDDFRVNGAMIGQTIDLEGFVVPLDIEGGLVSRFLLVPYFGACIHLPPPPPNQIVDVTPERALRLRSLQEPVRINGVLSEETSETDVAASAYAVDNARVSFVN